MNRYLASFFITAVLYAILITGVGYWYPQHKVSMQEIKTPKIETMAFSILSAPTLPSEPSVEEEPEPLSKLQSIVKTSTNPERTTKPEITAKPKSVVKSEPVVKPNPLTESKSLLKHKLTAEHKTDMALPTKQAKREQKRQIAKEKTSPKRRKRVKKKLSKRHKTKKVKSSKRANKKSRKSGVRSRARQNRFLARIRSKINAHKSYPRVAKRMRREGRVRVRFTILASGRVGNIRVSGTKIFYKSTKRAVRSAFPINTSKAPFRLPKSISLSLNYRLR